MAFVVAVVVDIELGDWSGCPAALLATLLLLPPMRLMGGKTKDKIIHSAKT